MKISWIYPTCNVAPENWWLWDDPFLFGARPIFRGPGLFFGAYRQICCNSQKNDTGRYLMKRNFRHINQSKPDFSDKEFPHKTIDITIHHNRSYPPWNYSSHLKTWHPKRKNSLPSTHFSGAILLSGRVYFPGSKIVLPKIRGLPSLKLT